MSDIKRDIHERIIRLLKSKYNLQSDELMHLSLLHPSNGLEPRDLLALFFELQKEFCIKFEEKDISERRFDLLNDIEEAILERLQGVSYHVG